jgi:hypothetical protein
MITDNPNEMPDPELVFRAAEEEPPQRLLDDYIGAIHELRRKKFTFREIAEWLEKFGFEVDHNAVWRAYANTVSDYEAHLAAEHDEELEKDEAMREAELNGPLRSVSSVSTPVSETATKTPVNKKVPKAALKKAKRKKH